jgi:hypothetical protein
MVVRHPARETKRSGQIVAAELRDAGRLPENLLPMTLE